MDTPRCYYCTDRDDLQALVERYAAHIRATELPPDEAVFITLRKVASPEADS